MTCIVAVAVDGRVSMAADSAVSITEDLMAPLSSVTPKVFKLKAGDEAVAIGISGEGTLAVMIRTQLSLATLPDSRDDERLLAWVLDEFVQNTWRIAEKYRCVRHGNSGRASVGVEIMLGVRGRIFELSHALGVYTQEQSYNAMGSGRPVALGSLYSTRSGTLSPTERLNEALDAASQFTKDVRGPYVHVSC